MLVVTKKIGEALWINGVSIGIVSARGNKVTLGFQPDEVGKRCDIVRNVPMPRSSRDSSPAQVAKASRDLTQVPRTPAS